MANVRIEGRRPNIPIIKLGNRGENLAETVRFELPAEYAAADVFLHMTIDNHTDVVRLADLSFTPDRKHTQYAGKWAAWLEALADNDIVWRSDVFELVIGHIPDDGEQIEQEYPSAIEEALRAVDTLTGVGAAAESLPTDADATVRMEEKDGKRVLVFGIPRGVSTGGGGGENGKDGVSPTITTDKITGGNRLTITDVNGTKTVDIMDGAEGPRGEKGETGPAGSDATVTADSVIDALGYVPAAQPKEAVVLQTLTVAEGDNVKKFRYDGKLRNFVLLVSVPAAAATVSGGMEVNKSGAGGIVAYHYLGQIVHTNTVRYMCMSSELCGLSYVDSVINTNANNSSSEVACAMVNRAIKATDASVPFTRVSVYAGGSFPVGTTFELRGVLADG